jgi:hypothetical protein
MENGTLGSRAEAGLAIHVPRDWVIRELLFRMVSVNNAVWSAHVIYLFPRFVLSDP